MDVVRDNLAYLREFLIIQLLLHKELSRYLVQIVRLVEFIVCVL